MSGPTGSRASGAGAVAAGYAVGWPRLARAALLVYGAGLATLVGACLWQTSGVFAYSLDDPYIHLALAEQIRHGHYGLHPGEPSSPSSSVVWPFLLAPFATLDRFELVPLALNVVFILGAVVAVARAVCRWLGPVAAPRQVALVLFLLLLGSNFWGMPLNGMEHSAQLLLTAWVVIGLVELVETGRVSPTLLAGRAAGDPGGRRGPRDGRSVLLTGGRGRLNMRRKVEEDRDTGSPQRDRVTGRCRPPRGGVPFGRPVPGTEVDHATLSAASALSSAHGRSLGHGPGRDGGRSRALPGGPRERPCAGAPDQLRPG